LDVPDQRSRRVGLGAILALALLLRLHGIHNPILDHPGWRQGDTAAIARNFAQLEYNPLRPQTDYNGPPPNYVELELQIVPFLAATLYRIFGVHEIFGRLISIAFSLATIPVLYLFARWLFASGIAGLAAAAAFAVYPGSVYYGRTFTPDTTMVFFLSAALYVSARWIAEDGTWSRRFGYASALCALALLAKPVSAAALIALPAMMIEREGWLGALRKPQNWALAAIAIVPYAAYDATVSSIAEWHWAGGILRKHVLPLARQSLSSLHGLRLGFVTLWDRLGMLRTTMLGAGGVLQAILGIGLAKRSKSPALLYAWLGGGLLYTFVVVAYEKVDYYLYLFLPLAALWTGGLFARAFETLDLDTERSTPWRRVAAGVAAATALGYLVWNGRAAVAPYYAFKYSNYTDARELDAKLDRDALVVMGHYDPSLLYYIHRKGWQEDPAVWTPFDEESAIRKGARYYIAVEPARLAANADLSAWLERFPLLEGTPARWPVYETANGKVLPGAQARWQRFRAHEKALRAAGSLPPEASSQPEP
jgi:hypothetical protein